MPKRVITENEIEVILDIVRSHPEGISQKDIAVALTPRVPERTLQFRIKNLVDVGKLVKSGKSRRTTKYSLPAISPAANTEDTATPAQAMENIAIPLSAESVEIRNYITQPQAARTPTGYRRQFLDSYRPNVSSYLSKAERAHLAEIGKPISMAEVAGTYAKQVLNRLLIDLAWNSSRLEGNTYSLLDTKRLIEFGREAKGRDRQEAQMIINHKDAIDFLVRSADEIGFNRFTILNLHAILAHNLLPDEAAAGRLRHIAVGIEKSTFHPLEVPQLIDECFNQLLATVAAIDDPLEQALFILVQLPYLQPFDDVNKRVSRLAANIPFIKHKLSPLSFTDVPRSIYQTAIMGIYELNKVDLMKDVFIWAYARSAKQYAAVRQSLGEPDPFRYEHSKALQQIISEIVAGHMDRKGASAYIDSWTKRNIKASERERFIDMAENELLNLHEGNFARYQIRPSEFTAWQEVWTAKLRYMNP